MVCEREVKGKPSMRIMSQETHSLPLGVSGTALGIIFRFTLD